MKRQASQLSLILAAFAFAPTALAGSEIVKCTDNAGHVTLTDQPCSANSTSVRLSQTPPVAAAEAVLDDAQAAADASEALAAAPAASTIERHTTHALVRQANWTPPPAPRSRPLANDVATLKAARLQLLMMDSAAKRQPRLAGLH
ncbi:MAG TPA: DUF4124 domain-containing protein [Telluria sp.]